jgi:hypothetical protein
MKKIMLPLAAGSASLMVSVAALAVPFNSFDPKSMAMGGAGVAVANPGSSPFFNPALMSVANKDDDFALELPIAGARVYDPDDFIDAVDNFNDQVVSDLDDAISNYNFLPGDSTPTIAAINAMNDEVLKLSNKPFVFDGGAAVVLAVPSESFGVAFSASATANFSGVLDYADADTVTNLTEDLTALDNCYVLADPAVAPAAFSSCVLQPGKFNFVDLTDPLNPQVDFTAQSTGSTPSDIKSKVRVIGVVMAEVGLTLSREMSMLDSAISVGVTPKMVSVTVLDYEVNADNADSGDIDGDDYSVDYSDFNMDIGIAMDHNNGWRTGFVIKNIIAQDYKAMNTDPDTGEQVATGRIVSLKPQARIGVSHTSGWSTLAVDVDLTENEALGIIGDKSQYVALGLEMNALDWAQIRLGYRADMVNSERNVASVGIGISPFGVHFDLAVAGNANEVGASMQLGFRF